MKWAARGSATTISPTKSSSSRWKRERRRPFSRRRSNGCAGFWRCAPSFACGERTARAQVQYARGQNVAPVFEGWERNPDGTFNMVFGYLNRNYEEEIDIPVGPDNTID